MTFTSFEFVIFFVSVLLIRRCLRSFAAEKWFLLAASILFYLSSSIPCIVLILFTSIMDYSIGRQLSQTTVPTSRRRLLLLSVGANLGLLGFFKYSNFFLENVWFVLAAFGAHLSRPHLDIILPPAISFYTFASISYVIDVYYERIPACGSARDYTLFVTFFPKLLSGPIVRASELLPQLRERVRASAADIEIGLAYFLVGAVKKLVLADQVAGHVGLIFSAPSHYDGPTLLMGLLGYAVQIYCDFSGYSDMAIGCARILGYRFPQNFEMPYSSVTITEFWRRWNITLSRWFRDYAFLPLETATRNNPYPTLRVSLNLTIMMVLVGLWHGPSWNFIIFGTIHGLALAVNRIWTVWRPFGAVQKHIVPRFVGTLCARLLTLGVIMLGFVFFRTQSLSDAASYLSGTLFLNHGGILLVSPYILAVLIIVLLVHLLVNKDRNLIEELPQISLPIRIIGYAGLLVLLFCFAATEAAPFIYLQF